MSWTDKEIDQLFKESAESVSFNYSDEYWKEMEAMLPQKKKKDFLWFITAFAFLGLVSLGFFRSLSTTDQNQSNKLISESVVVTSSEVVTETAKSDKQNLQATNNITKNKVEFDENLNASSSLTTVTKQTTPYSTEVTHPLKINVAQVVLVPSEGDIDPIRGKVNEANNLMIDGIDLGSEEEWLMSQLNVRPLMSSIDKSLVLSQIQPKRNKRILVSPYLELHGGLTESPLASSENLGSYYGAGAGIQLNSPFWTTTIGMNGSAYSFSDVQLTHFSKTYSYGSRYTTHELNYSNIYRLEGVLSVGRNFGKHEVNLGLRPSYILSNRIDYTEIDQVKDIRTEREVVRYTDGMKRFGLKSTVGYGYNIASTWTVGVNVGLQLSNTFEADFLGNSDSRLPFDGQVYLRKTLSFGK